MTDEIAEVADLIEVAQPEIPVAQVDNGVPAPSSGHPTVQEAQAMFVENPGLMSVLTDSGILIRDGVFIEVPEVTGA